GGFSLSVRVQTLATWALAAAATSNPRLPWVPEATRKAAEFLIWVRASSTTTVDPIYDAWVDLVLEGARTSVRLYESNGSICQMSRCIDPRPPLDRVRSELGPSGGRLIDRILQGPHALPTSVGTP